MWVKAPRVSTWPLRLHEECPVLAALWPCLIEANFLLRFPVGISSLLLILILGNVGVPSGYSISVPLSCLIVSVVFGFVYVVNGQRIM